VRAEEIRAGRSSGIRLRGPALITEYSATTYVARGFRVAIGGGGELILSAERAR
jgi:hypothetical protein